MGFTNHCTLTSLTVPTYNRRYESPSKQPSKNYDCRQFLQSEHTKMVLPPTVLRTMKKFLVSESTNYMESLSVGEPLTSDYINVFKQGSVTTEKRVGVTLKRRRSHSVTL